MKKVFYVLAVLTLLITAITGCRVGSAPLAEPVTIHVVATQDFGREIVFDRTAVIERRMNAQDVLAEVTEFETDGSYILEFEGLRGNDQVYWMYYINGLLSKYFAGGYVIRPGDVMHWDFHPWAGAHHGSSAIIGAFPEPLLHGYEGQTCATTVVFGKGFQNEAEAIANGLQELGVSSVSVAAEGNLTGADKNNNNIILIADSHSDLITDLNDKANPLGMYAYFTNDGINVTNYKFEDRQSYGAGTGVIQASQNLWSPLGTGACRNAIFMVSGVDEVGVKQAVQVLLDSISAIKNGEEPAIANVYGVIITPSGDIIRTPL